MYCSRLAKAGFVLFLLITPVFGGQIDKAFPGNKLALRVKPKYATHVPLDFECRFENGSKNDLWTQLAPYLEGRRFQVEVFDETGNKTKFVPSNGLDFDFTSRTHSKLPPGEFRMVPLAIPQLPPGKYRIVVERKLSSDLEVVDDANLRIETVSRFLDGFWSKDIFPRHMISKFAKDPGSREVFKTMIEPELYRAMHLDDEDKAVYVLTFLYVNFSALSSDRVERELHDSVVSQQRKNAERPHRKWTRFFASATALAGRIKSDKALSLVLTILEKEGNRPNGGAEIRFAAVRSLSDFKQEKAADELARIAGESPWGISGDQIICEAAHQLCIKKDPRALGILYQLYNKEQFRARKGKLLWSATALYDNPGADPFIRGLRTRTRTFVAPRAKHRIDWH